MIKIRNQSKQEVHIKNRNNLGSTKNEVVCLRKCFFSLLHLCVSKLHKSNTSLNMAFIGKVTSYHKKGEKCSYCCIIRIFLQHTHIVYTYSVQTHCNAQCSNTFLRISLTYSCTDTSTIDNCAFLKARTSATAA